MSWSWLSGGRITHTAAGSAPWVIGWPSDDLRLRQIASERAASVRSGGDPPELLRRSGGAQRDPGRRQPAGQVTGGLPADPTPPSQWPRGAAHLGREAVAPRSAPRTG